MEHARFEDLKIEVAATSAGQILELDDLIQDISSRDVVGMALARRTRQTCNARVCPHCQSNDVVLCGKDQNGRQRFKCRGCGRSYNILTGTPMARARKPEKWGQYLGCMTGHMPLRDIVASGIGVHLVTAWRWRHRFLQAAANDNAAVLWGLVEADTTFFPRSFKGSRGANQGAPRDARTGRPRGGANAGASREKVPVLTALDSGDGVFEAILGSLAEIEATLDGRIAAGSVLCSDDSAGYANAAAKAGAEHYVVFVSMEVQNSGRINGLTAQGLKPGRLGLRRINSYHRQLKDLIDGRCRGVATKYLAHYLGWHRKMTKPGFLGKMLLDRALG